MGQIPNGVTGERHVVPISMLLGHSIEPVHHILVDRRMVAFSPMEEGIIATSFGYKMVGTSNGCCSDVLADEPRIDVMFIQFDHNGINVLMFSRVSASEEAHDASCMHHIMKEGCKHGSSMNYGDSCLFFPKGILVCHPREVICVAFDMLFCQVGYKFVCITEACKLIVLQES